MEVVDELEGLPTDGRDRPREDAKIESRHRGEPDGHGRGAAPRPTSRSRTRRPARVIGTSRHRRREELRAIAERGRAAQPAWEALGFEGRGKILRRAQKWVHRQRRADRRDDRRRDRQDARGRAARRGRLRRQRVRLLGQARARLPRPTRRSAPPNPFVLGRKLVVRYRPVGAGRRDRAVELPADQLVRRLHPGHGGRQRRDPQAAEVDAADLAADRRGAARGRPARGRLPGRHRPRLETGAGADRPRRHDHVHRLHRDRQEDHGARAPRR